MSSPFQKRPQLSKTCKTYGSRRTSGQGTSNPSTRQQKSILLDSSDEEQSDTTTLNDQAAATQPVRSNGADSVRKGRTRQVERQVESEKLAAAVKTVRACGRTVAENVSTRVPARPSSGRRTRSSTLPADLEQEGTRSGESSTVWDEEAALQKRSEPKARARKRGTDAASTAATTNGANSPKRSFPSPHLVPSPALNASTQSHSAKRPSPPSSPLTDLSSDADVDPYRHIEPSSPPARKKRARLSAVAASPVATKSMSVGEGNSRRQAKKQEVAEDVPPPFEYVPLAERVAKASPSEPRTSGATTTIASEKTSRAPPQLAAATELIKPVPHRPYQRPAPAPSASATAVPTAAVPPNVPKSMAMSRPRPPPSPAKDLSSLFTKFSAASTSTAPAPQARVSLKRSASLVEASSGMVGRMKSGRRATVDEQTLEQLQEEEERSEGWRSRTSLPSSQTTPPLDFLLSIASASPVRRSVAMDRSLSQPVFPSSPLGSTSGSPRRSPSRPALNTANSLPFFGDRERAGSPSPSPSRPTIRLGLSSSIFPSYGGPAAGSAYRPVAFSGPPAGLLAAAGVAAGGPSRTYAAGRTVKRDEGEEALLAGGRPPHPSHPRGGLTAALSSSPHPSNTLPGLPPSLRRPLLAAARPPRETYASLRSKWGIDAEEDLDDQEEEESQGRGARVEGGGVLKKRGEGKRWGDEVGFMLEGLAAAGSGDEGAGRSSALEVLSKLHDRDWLRRLKASGLAESVYAAFRRGGAGEGKDKVLDIALLLLLALLLRDQRLSEPLFRLSPTDIARPTPSQLNSPAPSSRPSSPAMSRHNSQSQPPLDSQSSFPSFSSSPRKRAVEERDDRCDLMEVMKVLAEVEWTREDIGKGKEEGEAVVGRKRGKKDRGDARYVQSLRDIIDLSGLFVDERDLPITALNLLLLVTRSISSYTPRTIFQPQQLLCWSGALESIVWEGIVHEASKVAGRMEKYEKGLDLLPPSTSVGPLSGALAVPSLPTLQLSLQILEAVSAATPFALPSISTPTLLPSLANALSKLTLFTFLVALDAPSSSPALSEGETQVLALETLVAILGALYGLTTEVEWAATLLETSSSSEPETKGAKPPAATATAHVSRGELVLTLVRIVLAARRRSQECRPPPSLQVEAQTSDTEMPDRDEEDREEEANGPEQHLWDILSLSLGVLANLVDCVGDEEGMKDLLRTLDLNPACRARRKCSRFCVCPQDEKQTLIVALVQLAAQDSMEDAPNTVYQTSTLGFLRLTLGLSILSNPRNESIVLSTFLPSLTSDTVNVIAPLSAVLDALEDLAKIQEQQRQAQGLLLGGLREDGGAAVTQSGVEEETQLDRVQEVEEEDRSKRIRETVARLRRGVYERGE